MTLDTSNWDGKFKVKRSQVEVIGNINVKKSFFFLSHIFMQSGSIHIKQQQNDLQFILHISPLYNTFYQRKRVIFELSVCLSVTCPSFTQYAVESSYFKRR